MEQVAGPIHGFCSGIGTGGTITGIGEVLKAQNPDIEIWAVEPENAAILAGGTIGTHLQMGIGDGIIPDILNQNIYDEVYIITDEEKNRRPEESISFGKGIQGERRSLCREGAEETGGVHGTRSCLQGLVCYTFCTRRMRERCCRLLGSGFPAYGRRAGTSHRNGSSPLFVLSQSSRFGGVQKVYKSPVPRYAIFSRSSVSASFSNRFALPS